MIVTRTAIPDVLVIESGEILIPGDVDFGVDIGLPPNQVSFLRRLRQGNSKPIIVVLTGGSPLAIPEVHDLADAILYAREGGRVLLVDRELAAAEEAKKAAYELILGQGKEVFDLAKEKPELRDRYGRHSERCVSSAGRCRQRSTCIR